MTNAFYGGGHAMKSSRDFVFWCLKETSVYYTPADLFIPPRSVVGAFQGYQRIANCANNAGLEIPERYADLFNMCQVAGTFISPNSAMLVPGAVLFNQGTVTVSVGDGRRVVYEDGFSLLMKYVDLSQPANGLFEWAAKIPGLEY